MSENCRKCRENVKMKAKIGGGHEVQLAPFHVTQCTNNRICNLSSRKSVERISSDYLQLLCLAVKSFVLYENMLEPTVYHAR